MLRQEIRSKIAGPHRWREDVPIGDLPAVRSILSGPEGTLFPLRQKVQGFRRQQYMKQTFGSGKHRLTPQISVDSDFGPFDKTASERLGQGIQRVEEGIPGSQGFEIFPQLRAQVLRRPIFQRLRGQVQPQPVQAQRVASDISPAKW